MQNALNKVSEVLNFSIILNQKTGELTLKEGELLSLKIPKH